MGGFRKRGGGRKRAGNRGADAIHSVCIGAKVQGTTPIDNQKPPGTFEQLGCVTAMSRTTPFASSTVPSVWSQVTAARARGGFFGATAFVRGYGLDRDPRKCAFVRPRSLSRADAFRARIRSRGRQKRRTPRPRGMPRPRKDAANREGKEKKNALTSSHLHDVWDHTTRS